MVMRQLKLLEAFTLVTSSPKSIRRAVEIRESYRISFWDAGIIAVAEDADYQVIFSEDLNNGQYYAGVVASFQIGARALVPLVLVDEGRRERDPLFCPKPVPPY